MERVKVSFLKTHKSDIVGDIHISKYFIEILEPEMRRWRNILLNLWRANIINEFYIYKTLHRFNEIFLKCNCIYIQNERRLYCLIYL